MKSIKTKKWLSKLKKNFKRHVKLALVPHKANQYRPHLIRRFGIGALVVGIVALQIGYNVSTSGTVLGEKTTVTAADLLKDTNKERAERHLPALESSEKLARAAQLKATDMIEKQYWAHTAPDGTTPWQWFEKTGYVYRYAGENLAKNFRTSQAVTAAWMSSPDHKANVLGEQYAQVGFAVAEGTMEGKPVTLVVALYGTPDETGAITASLGARTAGSAPATNQQVGVLTRFGLAIQSMTPAALGSIVLILIAALVAFVAHANRAKLPKVLRQSWYRHHGLMKVGGMLSICLIIVFLYSGGQI